MAACVDNVWPGRHWSDGELAGIAERGCAVKHLTLQAGRADAMRSSGSGATTEQVEREAHVYRVMLTRWLASGCNRHSGRGSDA